MRNRLHRAGAAIVAWLGGYLEEFAIAAALILLAVGFWMAWRPGAFIIPALVILWLTIPSRGPFVDRHAPNVRRRSD